MVRGLWLVALAAVCLVVMMMTASGHVNGGREDRDLSGVLDYFFGERCMNELGCFSNGVPFFNLLERPISLLPEDRNSIATKFLLFTRSRPDAGLMFRGGNYSKQALLESGFKPSVATKFVVPGFISRYAVDWKSPLKDQLLKKDRCNVFLVDWTGGDGPLYEQAVANARVVGAEIAHFITFLEEITGAKPESMHLIGHSLGAHISGYAGKLVRNIGRISGADPAGPYFTNVDPVVRLDRTDATFVDVIHTNTAPSRFSGFGTTESIGHFDFYPNGGHQQPGCKEMGSAILAFLKHPKFGMESIRELSCSHIRSIQLFTSSLRNPGCKFRAVQIPGVLEAPGMFSWFRGSGYVDMGMDAVLYLSLVDKDRSLKFYLNTTNTEPFCMK